MPSFSAVGFKFLGELSLIRRSPRSRFVECRTVELKEDDDQYLFGGGQKWKTLAADLVEEEKQLIS